MIIFCCVLVTSVTGDFRSKINKEVSFRYAVISSTSGILTPVVIALVSYSSACDVAGTNRTGVFGLGSHVRHPPSGGVGFGPVVVLVALCS